MASQKPTSLSAKTLREAERCLQHSDRVMAGLVARHGHCRLLNHESSPFSTLVTSIISQMLSTKAADAIERRVVEKVGDLTPASFQAVSTKMLRDAGLSTAKANYILKLAAQVMNESLDLTALRKEADNDVVETLTALPGIGRWTAEMFLMFALGRPDILAIGDAGLQRAARQLYGEAVDLERIARVWKPYRSVASWYLWQHLDQS